MTKIGKERPILFTGDLVLAVLDGRKTQTRRPLKLRGSAAPLEGSISSVTKIDNHLQWRVSGPLGSRDINCPYGGVGDFLYGREKHAIEPQGPGELDLLHFAADGMCCGINRPDGSHNWLHKADPPYEGKWKPSIFMPRTATRMLLRITEVRLERLRCITNDEAVREGFADRSSGPRSPGHVPTTGEPSWWTTKITALTEFFSAWSAMYDRPSGGWPENPWVWVISFERVTL